VQREFNRRMKHRFEELDIEIAGAAPMIVVQPAPEHAAAVPPRGAVPVGA
jgi:hypothetical protein